MSDPPSHRPWDVILLQWRELAEQRRAHFFELMESGRWRRYYGEEEFPLRLREAVTAAEAWRRIAPRPDDAGLAA